jgi:hypothetical protein
MLVNKTREWIKMMNDVKNGLSQQEKKRAKKFTQMYRKYDQRKVTLHRSVGSLLTMSQRKKNLEEVSRKFA